MHIRILENEGGRWWILLVLIVRYWASELVVVGLVLSVRLPFRFWGRTWTGTSVAIVDGRHDPFVTFTGVRQKRYAHVVG